MPSSTLVFAKRSLSLSKIYAGVGAVLAAFGIFVIVALIFFAGRANAAVLSPSRFVYVFWNSNVSLHQLFCFTSMTKTTEFWSICFHLAGIKATSLSTT